MKRVLAVAINHIRIEFSHRSTFIFFLILPLVFTAVVGLALGGSGEDHDPRQPYALVNLDGGALSETLAQALEASTSSRPIATTLDRALAAIDDGEINIAVVIPETFSTSVAEGETVSLRFVMGEEDMTSAIVRESVRSAAATTGSLYLVVQTSMAEAERLQPFNSDAERESYADQALALATQLATTPSVVVETETGTDTSIEIAEGFEQSSPGQLVTWSLITLLGGSVAIVNERKHGTLRRLLTMPAHKAEILAGLILGRLFLGLIQMVILIVFGALAFDIPWGQSPLALGLSVFSFALASTSLGLFLATLARTAGQADGWTTMFSMLMAALGGAWWPLDITPPAYQIAVSAVPSTWAMRAFSDVILRGQGVEGVLLESGVLLGFAMLFFALGLWRFRFE